MIARLAVVGVLATGLAVAGGAAAHGAVAERIAALDEAIAVRPNDAELYRKRAELYALDESWTQAAEDLEEALALAADDADVMHRLADARLHLGDATEALRLAEAALARRPDERRALLIRARAREELGAWRQAVGDLSRLIELGDPPSPELYRERAEIQERAGDRRGAVAGLRQGVARLGPLVTLVEPAVEMEARGGDPSAALALVDRLDPALASSPRWLVRRGELLERAGRRDEAAAAFREALAGLDRLPPGRRDAPRQVALRRRLERASTTEVATKPPSDSPSPWGAWPALALIGVGAALGFRLQRR